MKIKNKMKGITEEQNWKGRTEFGDRMEKGVENSHQSGGLNNSLNDRNIQG